MDALGQASRDHRALPSCRARAAISHRAEASGHTNWCRRSDITRVLLQASRAHSFLRPCCCQIASPAARSCFESLTEPQRAHSSFHSYARGPHSPAASCNDAALRSQHNDTPRCIARHPLHSIPWPLALCTHAQPLQQIRRRMDRIHLPLQLTPLPPPLTPPPPMTSSAPMLVSGSPSPV